MRLPTPQPCLEPHKINLVLRLDILLTNYIFVELNCIIELLRKPMVHQCMLFFRCLASIRPSITHKIILEIDSVDSSNVFCAATETLVQ